MIGKAGVITKLIENAEIKQPGMNPWKKVLKRPIFTDGDKCFIRHDGITSVEIEGRSYREVKKVGETWFLI